MHAAPRLDRIPTNDGGLVIAGSTLIPHSDNPHSGSSAVNQVGHDKEKTLVILDARALDRECFVQGLVTHGIDLNVVAYSTSQAWREDEALYPPPAAIVMSIGGHKVSEPGIIAELTRLSAEYTEVPIIILADSDDLDQVLTALEHNVRGYIPTSVGVKVCAEAIHLALAGGTFVPASSMGTMRSMISERSEPSRPMARIFTQRQEEVARALRRGKANKVIAYELNLRESTVKVHIRNIMRKLKATNRTEVAYKINELFPDQNGLTG